MGLAGVFAEASGFEPWLTTFYRVGLGGLVLGLLLLWRRDIQWPSPKLCMFFLALGLVLGLHWFAFFQSLRILGVILGSAMIGVQPLIIGTIAAVLLNERFTPQMLVSAAITLVGFAILGFGDIQRQNLWLGVSWSLFAFVLFALLVVANRKWVRSESPLVLTFLQMIGALPLTAFMTQAPLIPQDFRALCFALVLGILCTGLAHSLYNASMRVLSAPLVGLLLSLEVVYGLLGGWVIGDAISQRELIAIVFITNILFFDVVRFLKARRKTNAPPISSTNS